MQTLLYHLPFLPALSEGSVGRECYFHDYTKPTCTGSACLDTIRCAHAKERCFSFYSVAADGSSQVLNTTGLKNTKMHVQS